MRLKISNISKQFPGVKALSDISIDIFEGEVHAVCGENGAGKSTLMNIIAGNIKADQGVLEFNDQQLKTAGPQDAFAEGIATVYQHLSLIESLNIAENIFANEPPVNRFGLIQYKELFIKTERLLTQLNIKLKPQTLVSKLSAAERQMVEIAKALAKNPQLLILDEPTASLTDPETTILFKIINDLKRRNVSVVYISHRLKEIFKIADRISILKDGKYQGTFTKNELSEDTLIARMVGRNIQKVKRESHLKDKVLIEVRHLEGKGFKDISFKLYEGEILGLAGLVGAGRTEIAKAIIGAEKSTGTLLIGKRNTNISHPVDAIQQRIAYVPEDRKREGLFLDMSIKDNIVASKLNTNAKESLYNDQDASTNAELYKDKLRIVSTSIQQRVVNLSGGNQQKVVLSKWLLTDPDVLIVDEPTHGIDIGAKFEIYELINDLAAKGKGILLISSELPELLQLCDRILVIKKGSIAGELIAEDATEEKIMALAT